MEKILKYFLIVFTIMLVTGCSNKECSKWITKNNGTTRNCSNIEGYYEKMYCEMKNKSASTTQECVEWK